MSFGARLRRERLQRLLSQEALAAAIGISPKSISRWEQDQAIPHGHVRLQLCRFLQLRPEELFTDLEEQQPSQVWSMPLARNPFFTGREDLLECVHAHLSTHRGEVSSQTYALSGMGGIGKTQIAIEYAYRYAQKYRAVFWVAAETAETRLASLQQIAEVLTLPERQDEDQTRLVDAVYRWLSKQQNWLLIADNVENLEDLQRMMPPAGQGALLLTTRHQALGVFAQGQEVPLLMGEKGVTLLLLRAKRQLDCSPAERTAALSVVTQVEGLPLALDQAGAYIEETGCGVDEYRDRLSQCRKQVLARRGSALAGHPASVSATLHLSIQQAERRHPVASEVLRMCAFLHSEAIPEELLVASVPFVDPLLSSIMADPFVLDRVLAALRTASLLTRHPETRSLSLHRLVQVVVRDQMDSALIQRWSEWTVQTVNAAFPVVEFATWPACERCLPQALACVPLIEQAARHLPAAVELLFKVGSYLLERGLRQEAELHLMNAISLCEELQGPDNPALIPLLVRRAELSNLRGPSEHTVHLVQRALTLAEHHLGANHLQTAAALAELGVFYREQGKAREAELVFRHALAIRERELGENHPETANALDYLGVVLYDQGRYEEALVIYKRAIQMWEQQVGPEHPQTALALNNLAAVYRKLGQYAPANVLLQRALAILEQPMVPEHWYLGYVLNHLTHLTLSLGQNAEALAYGTRALRLREEQLGATHPLVATSLVTLATVYLAQEEQKEAEPLLQRALVMWEQVLGSEHPHLAYALTGLADLAMQQGKGEQAAEWYQRACTIREHALGPEHPEVAIVLNGLAKLARSQGLYAEAESLAQRALHIREQTLGFSHLETAETLHTLALLHEAQGHQHQAQSFYGRSLHIHEQVLGSAHPLTRKVCHQYRFFLEHHSFPKGSLVNNLTI